MSMKYKILGSIEAVQKNRHELLQKAVIVVQSPDYTEEGRMAKIREMIEPYEKKVSSYAEDIEKMFADQIEKVTVEEQNEQERRNNSLEYQQMLQTKAAILKTAIGEMSEEEIYNYTQPFIGDPVAISLFKGILRSYNQDLTIRNTQKHKMPLGVKWDTLKCTYGEAAKKLNIEKNSVLDVLEKMSFKNYYALGTSAVMSALHDKTLDAEIQCVMDYVKKNIA